VTAPSLVVTFALEETRPRAEVHATSARDRARLRDWLDAPDRRTTLDFLIDEREELFAPEAGEHLIVCGSFAGKTLTEISALAGGLDWFRTMLARCGPDDPLRAPVEAFVESELPELWIKYLGWREQDERTEREVRQP